MPRRPIDTRLVIPPPPPRHVPRPRLITALDDAQDSPLTLIAAGPGAGKTVLLSDWARHRDAPTAWLTLTSAENEPRQFWRLFLSAVRASGELSEGELPPVSPPIPASDPTALLDSLLDSAPASPTPLVLVLDDAHLLSHPELLTGLDSVIRGSHPRLHLVLAARSDPLLPLHRYRLAGQMHELRARDLAMTRPEIRELLAAHDVSLPEREFEVLVARTEGWAAGVRLSAIRMQGTPRPADFVAELALDQGSIGEYLMDEVLDRQTEPVRRLLIETSFLSEVSGELADAITGLDGCADMLDALARSNSFVIPLDQTRTRFRYHQLLSEILHYLLRRRAPQLPPMLFGRAASWFQAQGDLPNALYWAVRAGDQLKLAALLVHGGLAHAFVQRLDLTASGLRDVLPSSVPAGSDELQSAQLATARLAITAMMADDHTAAEALAEARATLGELGATDPDLRITGDLVELILAQKADDLRALDSAAGRLLAASDHDPEAPRIPGLRASVLLARARLRFFDGQLDDVDTLLQDALAQAEQDGVRKVELEVLAMIMLVNAYGSRLNRADSAEQRAEAILREMRYEEPPATMQLARSLRAFIGGDLTATARAIRQALASDAIASDPVVEAILTTGQAEVLLACGQATDARRVLQTGIWADRTSPALVVMHRDMVLARIETALGRARGALRFLRQYKHTPFEVAVAVPSAHAYLALGELDNAQTSVRHALTGIGGRVTRFRLVEAVLCDAQIAQRSGDCGRTLELLERALELGNGEIVLPFANVADVFAELLARHPAVAARWPTPPSDSAEVMMAEVGAKPAAELPEALTEREQAVLRFLATSMSTAEIADELCLSVNTVKTHLAAIYRKLAARKRREAVLRARDFELL